MTSFLILLEQLDLFQKKIDYYDKESILKNYKIILTKISEIKLSYPFEKPNSLFVTKEIALVFLNLTDTIEFCLLLEKFQTDVDILVSMFKNIYIRRKSNIKKELEDLDNKIDIIRDKLFNLLSKDPTYKLLNEVLFSGLDENNADNFWVLYHKTHINLPHICDFSIDELKEKHKNVLILIQHEKYDYKTIGLLLSGECYDNVWDSRSCSGHMSKLVNGKDYLDFYCGSSSYYWLCFLGLNHVEFWEAMEKDGFKNLWNQKIK